MKRWLFNLAAALSLLLSIAAAAAWAMSHARPPGWRLIGVAHSADLRPVPQHDGAVLFTAAAGGTNVPHGFWDAGWLLSRSGRLTVLGQAIDYEGPLRRVYSSPPSLIVEVPGEARPPAVVFGGMPEAGPPAGGLGFAWHSEEQPTGGGDGAGGPVSARAWMLTVPYWFIVLLGLPMPLVRVRVWRKR